VLDHRPVDATGVLGVGEQHLRPGIADAVADALVAVQDGHRQEDRARLPHPKNAAAVCGVAGSSIATRSPGSTPLGPQDVCEPVGIILELAPADLLDPPPEVLVDHRQLVARVAVAHVDRDVVALGHVPVVLRACLLIGEKVVVELMSPSSRPPGTRTRSAWSPGRRLTSDRGRVE